MFDKFQIILTIKPLIHKFKVVNIFWEVNMKKIIYIVIVFIILLVLSMLLKGNDTTTNEVTAPTEATVEAVVPAEVAPLDESSVVVDVEPTTEVIEAVSEGVIDEAGNTVEAVSEDVVEENPSATADEGETVVE